MRHPRILLLAIGLLAAAAAPALAQGSPPNMAAIQKWRDQHRYHMQLRTMLTSGLQECERSKNTALKPAQAKQILAIVNPYRKKPKMKPEEAKGAIQRLQKIFDPRQLSAIDKALKAAQTRAAGGPRPGGGPGGAPAGGARPGGAGGAGGGNRPRFDPARMTNFNPFNPDRTSPFYQQSAQRNQLLFAFLEGRAAGKNVKLQIPPPGR